MLLLHAAAVFTSAALLFLVQPMAGKMLLPSFGGAPAVWTTSLVFYQAVLLLGYLGAHLAATRLTPRAQALAYWGALLLAIASLPVAPPPGAGTDPAASPVLAVLAALARTVGLPFVALSASGPLLQGWFARSPHRAARDPYFLYAVSNFGSMLALLAYPSLVEPHLGLSAQSHAWSWGFVALAALALGCGALQLRHPPGPEARAHDSCGLGAGPRLLWLGQALLPSSLLMGVTLYLTTDRRAHV